MRLSKLDFMLMGICRCWRGINCHFPKGINQILITYPCRFVIIGPKVPNTSGSASDDKFINKMTLPFQWRAQHLYKLFIKDNNRFKQSPCSSPPSMIPHWSRNHVTNFILTHNWNFVNTLFALILTAMIQSGPNFAHEMSAQLLCHVQNWDQIGFIFLT